jgi:beta-glucosidase
MILAAAALAGCGEQATGPRDDSTDAGTGSIHVEGTSADNPAVVPTSRADNPRWVRWHEKQVAKAKRGGVRVMFLGDSIVEQWAVGGLGVWRETFRPIGGEIFGISADRTEHVLWRLEHGELEGISPEVVVLMIGTNNLKSGPVRMSPADTAAGVVAVVDLLRRKLPNAKLLVMSILPRQPEYDWIDAAIRETNDILRRLNRLENVEFVDIAEAFRRPDGSLDPKYYRRDLLHLNRQGYQLWAEAVEPKIRRALAGS